MRPSIPVVLLLLALSLSLRAQNDLEPLPGTEPLTWSGDIADLLVKAADKFLLREIKQSVATRARHWNRDTSSPEAYVRSVEKNRQAFARIIGLRDARPETPEVERLGVVAESSRFRAVAFRWRAFGDVHGEGLLLEPVEMVSRQVVVIPDADQTPEDLAGLGSHDDDLIARRLAENGCRVIIPTIINRGVTHRNLSNREFLYRPAFELGRHLIGYETQKVLAAVDWLAKQSDSPISVAGWGEGGLLAFYAAALDARIASALVSGCFGPRESVWDEPAYRNVFGLLEQFGDAEIASLIAPRRLIIEQRSSPAVTVLPGTGGKPGRLTTPRGEEVTMELDRARSLAPFPAWLVEGNLETLHPIAPAEPNQIAFTENRPDPAKRHADQFHELDRHNQWLLSESPYVRADYMKGLKTDSLDAFSESIEPYRDYFAKEVVGQFDYPLEDPHPRSRLFSESATVRAHEVVLNVYPGLFAYGILLEPKGLAPNEKRPVVVCQHGLEGRPQDLVGDSGFGAYKAFAMRLAERGFITFAPQNLYIFEDRFRTLQFKANAVKKTLFSMIVPQHQQIVNWLGKLPNADPERIAFYGLSYGGKSAMRIPPLVPEYCLSICSADFNDWVWKNASTRSPYSYVWSGEYEIFEFDLGSTFNYSEMAALIAPRPFMVERGHFDGVAPDERVALEYAKVRFLYSAKLKIPERTEIEFFDGPHTINGKGTFNFLHRHLDWPVNGKEDAAAAK